MLDPHPIGPDVRLLLLGLGDDRALGRDWLWRFDQDAAEAIGQGLGKHLGRKGMQVHPFPVDVVSPAAGLVAGDLRRHVLAEGHGLGERLARHDRNGPLQGREQGRRG